jgi:hypothetical protein
MLKNRQIYNDKILKLILFIPLISFRQEKSETKSEYQIMLECRI